MVAVRFGRHFFNRVHHIETIGYAAEHSIAPILHHVAAVQFFGAVVQKGVVVGIDEELRAGGMRVGRARHGNRVFFVAQTVAGFVLNAVARVFFVHVFRHAAALNHEAGNHAVENHAVIKAIFHILLEIGGGNRGFFMVQFQCNHAEIGMQFNRHNFSLKSIKKLEG